MPILPSAETRKVLDSCKGNAFVQLRDEAIIRVLYNTGARLSEVANLQLDDVDLNLDTVQYRGKGAKERRIRLGPKTARAVSRLRVWFGTVTRHGEFAGPAPASGARWEHDGVTARLVLLPVGFRKRRAAPGVELTARGVRTQFLCRQLTDLFDNRIDSIESTDGAGTIVFLCLTGQLAPTSAAEELLAHHDPGCLALLQTKPQFNAVVVLPPRVSADFGHWMRALP